MEVTTTTMPPITESDKYRFWSKVELTANPDKCWNWIGSKRRRGYGQFCITLSPGKERNIVSSRLAYFIHTNVDPTGNAVLHTCDNTSCVNPNHLVLGTNKDNTADMMKKGRGVQPKGSHHGQSKLTENDVLDIKAAFYKGATQVDLSRKYSVYQSVISRIVNNKSWKHISS